VEQSLAFYRIRKIKYKETIYYYLYKEWYDPDAKKKRSKLIGRCDEIEKIVETAKNNRGLWCGGWDLNPRRPMPAGLEPLEEIAESRKTMASFYPSYVKAEDPLMSGKSDEGHVCISLSDSLIRDFVNWLRVEEGVGERTIRNYVMHLKKALNLKLCGKNDVGRYFEVCRMSKGGYEALRRLLTFIEKKMDGFDTLVNQLKKALPRKPKTATDTYIPPDSMIIQLREKLRAAGEPLYTVYTILVSTGCRLSEACTLLHNFNRERLVKVSEDVYRYHIDLQRKSKNVMVLYLPREVVERVAKLDKHVPHPDNIAKAFEKSGLPAKYIRKWFRQTLKRLGVDSEIIEFIQGRVSALGIGAKHYTDFIPLTDEAYTKTIYPHIKKFL